MGKGRFGLFWGKKVLGIIETLFDMVILVIVLQFENAISEILLTLSGIMTFFSSPK